ncbi:MAG: hypothetical protein ACHQ6U_10365 [Thermodesulfobacteriota bacterium]
MGKFNIFISIIAGLILSVLLLVSFVVPFVAIPILAAFVSLVGVSFYLLKEDRSLAHRAALKSFYCPFRKMIVDAKFRPSLFTYRTYDDVLKCSAFKDRVRCQKRCLEMPELKFDHRPMPVTH